MKKILFSLAVLLVLNGCSKPDHDDSKEIAEEANDDRFDKTGREDDVQFAMDAADGGMLEVKLAQLALTNGASSEVKNFAQTMINDHTKANEELKTLAESKGIVLPTTLSDENQKDYTDLSEKKGADFDKAYCDFMVKDHKDDIDEFKKEAEKGNDPEIKDWASGKVPTLENHLSMAESMKESLKK
ncbi:MAG TPA: DUF4142 domain-containing protein [Cyclobacteriaceae bacterium]|nr:DUF4142 domain-containing protein [Cyclobacteriaceae bacterium]